MRLLRATIAGTAFGLLASGASAQTLFWSTQAQPIAMEEGLRFAIREGGRTVGAGVVAKILE